MSKEIEGPAQKPKTRRIELRLRCMTHGPPRVHAQSSTYVQSLKGQRRGIICGRDQYAWCTYGSYGYYVKQVPMNFYILREVEEQGASGTKWFTRERKSPSHHIPLAASWWCDAWTKLPGVLVYKMLDFRGDRPSISLSGNALLAMDGLWLTWQITIAAG